MRSHEVLKVERKFTGYFNVDAATVRFSIGENELSQPQERLCVDRPDAVAVLVHHTERDQLAFVRQFRYPCLRYDDPWPLEIAAGAVDEGESSQDAAIRECAEELGYKVGTLTLANAFYSSCGSISERIWVYYARVTEADRIGAGGGIDEEGIQIEWWDRARAFRLLDEPHRCLDVKLMVGLRWLKNQPH